MTQPTENIQSITYAQEMVNDLRSWLTQKIEESQIQIETSLEMLTKAQLAGDQGQRAFPTIKTDLLCLANHLNTLENQGLMAAAAIDHHLQDLREM